MSEVQTLVECPVIVGTAGHVDHGKSALIEALTGKTVSLTCRTDPTLLGGITLRYGGIQLDDSIRSRLERLRRSLSQTVV